MKMFQPKLDQGAARHLKEARPDRSPIPWFSGGCLSILLAFAPYAMTFRPYPPYTTDALYPYRVTLIVFGLVATDVAFAELIVRCFRGRIDLIGLAPFVASFLACAVVGWRSYPYWANGVYQVGIGEFPPMDQDPKGLIPMGWIGEVWRLSVMLLYLLCYLAIPLLSLASLIALLRRRFVAGGVTAFCIAIALTFMLAFSPDYMTWLLD